jgi:type IV pilus assembly protein PilB
VVDDAVSDGPMVRLVDALLEQAAKDKASDLHIEPTTDKVLIRLRIDGVLHDSSEAPLEVLRPMVSRLKVLSGLDIAQQRIPQDGRFSTTLQGRQVDVRVATVPTVTGEAMVLRLLDASRGVIDLPSLGLSPDEMSRFEPAFRAAQGGVFVTGPTGSGKTSTLYAALSAISTRDKSIVSVEDPVEYRLYGVRQIQAHPKAGLTFPVALRSILRADPDVIFVGEVRDGETARMAAEAAITGHLVLSSLHTTRAAAAPVRLIDMGIEPYLVASSLTCVVAQRLIRKICDDCAQPVARADATRLLHDLGAGEAELDIAAMRAPVGCPICRNTGYSGRSAIFEIMPVTEDVARMIVERAPTAEVERLAVAQGMDTLRTAALKRVARGALGVDEMLRVIS